MSSFLSRPEVRGSRLGQWVLAPRWQAVHEQLVSDEVSREGWRQTWALRNMDSGLSALRKAAGRREGQWVQCWGAWGGTSVWANVPTPDNLG